MYKDKSAAASRGRMLLRGPPGRRRTLLIGVLLVAFLYVVYLMGSSMNETSPTTRRPSSRGGVFTQRIMAQKKAKSESGKRQAAIRQAFVDSWKGYEKYAWGKDIYRPVSGTGENMVKHGDRKPLGWIIVDSLDTMQIMGLTNELKKARTWVKNSLSYDIDNDVNTFETTIRMLGGLLSAYYLSNGDQVYLDKAVDLGERLKGAFGSYSGVPYASVNLHSGQGVIAHDSNGASSTAEAATLQLEFKYLAHLTGDKSYWDMAQRVMQVLDSNHMPGGLVPIFVQPKSGRFQGNHVRLGSRGDSYYEYLIKQYLQTSQKEPVYREMYDEAVRGIKDHMIGLSEPSQLTFIGELPDGIGGKLDPKMDHLVCFAGGMLALGATEGLPLDEARHKSTWSATREADMNLAMEITRTCYETYAKTETGLGPEIVVFNTNPEMSEDFTIKKNDLHNLQRPETVESLYVLYRLTKNPIYREWGWNIFESFQKWTKVSGDGGYASVDNVRRIPPPLRDNMESFWLSETLKYLYLLFEDEELLPLDEIVFNTEAHPFPKIPLDDFSSWART